MKSIAKSLIVTLLSWQVRRLYRKNHDLKVVAVTGSVGKTSTKLAISKILSQGLRVQYQDGNYNDLVSVPLVFFGQKMPSLLNPLAWLVVLIRNEIKISKRYPYDIVVLELGTDGPGQLVKFHKYLKVEIGVLTAVTPEHMEYFKDLDAVAAEELEIFKLSSLTLVNTDMIEPKYLQNMDYLSYGMQSKADYQLTNLSFDQTGSNFDIASGSTTLFSGKHEAIAEPLLYAILAAVAVSKKLGLSDQQIDDGIKKIEPAPGRMQILEGINNSIIIDDTYNSSPEAVKAALATLTRQQAAKRIAILGNMNELGKYSKDAHESVGMLCDPKKIDLVVTIGPDANKYLADAAKKNGCEVKTFNNPYDAGSYLKDLIVANTVVLAKGSQNKVFAEEVVKQLLADPADSAKLVRQSAYWMKQKDKSFLS